MARKIIGSSWERNELNNHNSNYEELYRAKDDAMEVAENSKKEIDEALEGVDEFKKEIKIKVDESDEKSSNAEKIAEDTNERMNQIISGETDSAEIIDSRKPLGLEAAKNLGERLNMQFGNNEEFRPTEISLIKKMSDEFGERAVNVMWFGATGDGINDDTIAIQKAIDYAASLLDSVTSQPSVYFPPATYKISGLKLRKGVKISGKAILKLIGKNNIGIDLRNVLYTVSEDLKVQLTEEGQIGIVLDSEPGETSSQLNTFRNIWVEGDSILNTKAVDIGYSWTNSFYDCKLFRTAVGISFNNADSNANFFYGCEIRGARGNKNNKSAIIHNGGKNNTFKGGVIETHAKLIEATAGTIVFDNVYTEDFSFDRGIVLKGTANVHFDKCLIKTKVSIEGGQKIEFSSCDMSKGGMPTNANSPFVAFLKDVGTSVVMRSNDIKNDFIHSRFGEFQDAETNTWSFRSKNNLKEQYLDRSSIYQGVVKTVDYCTGNGANYDIPFSEELIINNPYNEITNEIFRPIDNGVFRFKLMLQISGVNDSNKDCYIFLRERGLGYREIMLEQKKATNRTDGTTGNLTLTGECILQNKLGLDLNFYLNVNGSSSKNVHIRPSDGTSIRGYYTIERVA